MGTAVHQFAAANDGLLPQNLPDDAPAEHRGSHVTRVLPYLEYEKLAWDDRAELDWAHPANAKVVDSTATSSVPRPHRAPTGG